jgi:hypothetical protein
MGYGSVLITKINPHAIEVEINNWEPFIHQQIVSGKLISNTQMGENFFS